MPALGEVDFSALDYGIRLTVRWLREHHFDTTDSGDGRSKFEAISEGEALDAPHVFMRVRDTWEMVAEANRLRRLLDERGLIGEGRVEVSYSPDDGVAILALFGIDDDALMTAMPRVTNAKDGE